MRVIPMRVIFPTFITFFILMVAPRSQAATVLFEDFEITGSARTGVIYMPSTADSTNNIGTNSYFGVVELAGGTSAAPNLAGDVSFSNVQGNDFYAAQDINGAAPVTSVSLNWTGINITGLTDLDLSLFVAEDTATDGNEDWDSSDSFQVAVQLDGGGFNPFLAVESAGTPNRAPLLDANFDGTGDSTPITDAFTQFNGAIGMGSVLDIRITVTNLTALDEDIAFDNVLLTGTAVPEPSVFGLVALGTALVGFRKRKSMLKLEKSSSDA